MSMIRALYPKDWKEMSDQVKWRVGWKCEWCGKQCRRPGEPFVSNWWTLTVAHINQRPWDCNPENLMAMCAPCHFQFDSMPNAIKRGFLARIGGAKGPTQLHMYLQAINALKPDEAVSAAGFIMPPFITKAAWARRFDLYELHGIELGPPTLPPLDEPLYKPELVVKSPYRQLRLPDGNRKSESAGDRTSDNRHPTSVHA